MTCLLIVDDDPDLGFGLASALECDGRRIIVCRDLESAQIMLDVEPVTDIVTDVKLSGPFRFEGLDFITEIQRVAPAARVIVMTGHVTDELEAEAQRRGADAVLSKPFAISALEPLLTMPAENTPSSLILVPTIIEIIGSGALRPRFQPIVSLADGATHGVESLARYRGEGPFARPDLLFTYATRRNDVARLEAACIERTMREAVTFPESLTLFMNVHPAALDDMGVVLALESSAQKSGIDLSRVVLEITEQQEIRQHPALFEAIEELRGRGCRFAFDDVGVAYSHLPLIERIRPVYLKISQLFGTLFEADPTRTKIVRNIVSLAAEFSCAIIIEGVEDQSTADAARDLGIAYGQGYLFGRAEDAP
ncbi:MAG TPA: EAL domain-containing response regulator [Thermoanaerobaculia bacterium]|jgi:EAL domain-containing protein (putative c-di-GMP-specific phosphodiesterase class I)/ActR/RegA family two-component response regulator|nr:EAL domain-containing response regulator [Thermoanaerobaculia bacterium]